MEELYKEIIRISISFKHYRLIIDDENICVRFTPHSPQDEEINFFEKNTDYGLCSLTTRLQLFK